MKIVSFTIARMGSKRLPNKNLRILNGKPMLAYALEAARDSEMIDEAYINTDSHLLGDFGQGVGVKFYQRDPRLAQDHIILDEMAYDFIQNVEADVFGMVNSVCPLTTPEDIDLALKQFVDSDADSMITVKEEQLHAFLRNESINFDSSKTIPMTQDLDPVQVVTWNFAFWKADSFRTWYEKHASGVFSGKVHLYPIAKEKSVKVSDESDFQIASALLRAQQAPEEPQFYNE